MRLPTSSARARGLAFVALAALGGLLVGCTPASGATLVASGDDRIRVVASTNVYADIARQIAGEAATVEALVTSAAQDPHEYEATARDYLAVSRADIVIANGGGYDAFVDALVDASGTDAVVITATAPDAHEAHEDALDANEDAHDAHDHPANEHVWFDLDIVREVAADIAEHVSEAAPNAASDIATRHRAFDAALDALAGDVEQLSASATGSRVIATEPAPEALLEAAGIQIVTPPAFTEAVEEGSGVAPRILLDTLDVVASGAADAVVVNPQTGGSETDLVVAAAADGGIPVIEMFEVLPVGESYQAWMAENINRLTEARQT